MIFNWCDCTFFLIWNNTVAIATMYMCKDFIFNSIQHACTPRGAGAGVYLQTFGGGAGNVIHFYRCVCPAMAERLAPVGFELATIAAPVLVSGDQSLHRRPKISVYHVSVNSMVHTILHVV